ncbi:hypothetical protein [Hymenobacter sp. IS2118]|uniref:hypothetical protein n=1 Tax=Hymenobacter sp. IS2118 TaxID=1505605 RepID=UPI000555A5D1|nr:hypothetical protein [Hymenobacter sp. IS2118]
MEGAFKLGDILNFYDDTPCVVVGLSGQVLADEEVPEEHIAVWFGYMSTAQKLEGAENGIRMEVRTIPEEYFKKGLDPEIVH